MPLNISSHGEKAFKAAFDAHPVPTGGKLFGFSGDASFTHQPGLLFGQ